MVWWRIPIYDDWIDSMELYSNQFFLSAFIKLNFISFSKKKKKIILVVGLANYV